MKKRQIRIDQGRIIPLYPRFLITGLLVALLIYLMDQSPKPDLIFVVGLITGSALVYGVWGFRKVLAIDQTASRINQYYWLVGFNLQNQQEQGKGTAIILRKIGRAQKAPGKFPWKVFLTLEDGNEVFMISREYREEGEKVARSIANKLGLEVRTE